MIIFKLKRIIYPQIDCYSKYPRHEIHPNIFLIPFWC